MSYWTTPSTKINQEWINIVNEPVLQNISVTTRAQLWSCDQGFKHLLLLFTPNFSKIFFCITKYICIKTSSIAYNYNTNCHDTRSNSTEPRLGNQTKHALLQQVKISYKFFLTYDTEDILISKRQCYTKPLLVYQHNRTRYKHNHNT